MNTIICPTCRHENERRLDYIKEGLIVCERCEVIFFPHNPLESKYNTSSLWQTILKKIDSQLKD